MNRNSFLLCLLASVLLVPPAAAQEDSEQMPQRPGRSVQVPGGTVVLPPLPVPPEELIGKDSRVVRAGLLLDRIEVFDTYAARFARQGRRVLDGRSVDCSAVAAIEHALDLVVGASGAARASVVAELALLPAFESLEPLRDRVHQAEDRATDVEARLWPELLRSFAAQCPARESAAPTPWLPDDERAAADGRTVIFVKTKRPRGVVWLDGSPAGAVDDTGWAALVASAHAVTLCEAEPEDDACDQLVEVDATPAAAFDLGR